MEQSVVTGLFTLGGVLVGGVINGGVTYMTARSTRRVAIKRASRLADGYADKLNMYAGLALSRGEASEVMRERVLLPAAAGLEALREEMASHPRESVWDAYLSLTLSAELSVGGRTEGPADWEDLAEKAIEFERALGFSPLSLEEMSRITVLDEDAN